MALDQHNASNSHNATLDRKDERPLGGEDWEMVSKEELAPERRASDPGTTTSAHFELEIGLGKCVHSPRGNYRFLFWLLIWLLLDIRWKHTVYSANYQWTTRSPHRDGDSKDKEEGSGKTR